MINIETILAVAAILMLLSIIASKVSDKLGIPSLLLFLAIGMLAGSDGLGGINFDDPYLAQGLGVVALSFILFAGGLDTEWVRVRPSLWKGISLSTLGVLITASIVGWFATEVLGFSWLEGLLLGGVVSSTDAAAVFSVLRSKKVSLKGHLKPLLELEAGSNDPMAVLLTITFIGLLLNPGKSYVSLVPMIFLQLSLGAATGYAMGNGMIFLINYLKLGYEGLYPVLSMALVVLTYGATALLGGNGFLAVYIAGLVMGNRNFVHKRSMIRFHDGLVWLFQIAMFVVLGLLVFPSRLIFVTGTGLIVSMVLILVARPAGVFISTLFSGMSIRENLMISWVGLRGAVPIILATFPLLAGIPKLEMIFNIVFFVVITSALFQGPTIPMMARWLRVEAPLPERTVYPIAYEPTEKMKCDLVELEIPDNSPIVNKQLVEIGFPSGALIVLISRNNEFLIPDGRTVLQAGDRLLVLADKEILSAVRTILAYGSNAHG
ncbi:MAG: potassium/proton antiporter [Candidatus Tectomicrobia bacterium]|uniref:Potassium/proton antiporter n=1 Tax=Tectimicrobiota bacterium TaxID=2528274 RepID=A0A933GKC3_UNCTE|nr:potassium/proton antiporter [Candidatus Tectomicrobia bacterium]